MKLPDQYESLGDAPEPSNPESSEYLDTVSTYQFVAGMAFGADKASLLEGSTPQSEELLSAEDFWRGFICERATMNMYPGVNGNYPAMRFDSDPAIIKEFIAFLDDADSRAPNRVKKRLDPPKLSDEDRSRFRRRAVQGRFSVTHDSAQKVFWLLFSDLTSTMTPRTRQIVREAVYSWKSVASRREARRDRKFVHFSPKEL